MGRGRGAVSATAREQDTILARLAFDPALCAGGVAIIVLVAFAVTMLGVDRLNPFTGLTLAHGAIYVAAIVWVLRCQPRPRDLALILLVALVVRAIAITAPPALTTDAFRYVWDGRIQWAGFNPYLFVPSDPALAHLRDGAIYPNVHLKDVAVTIYPPFAEMLFMAANAISDSLWGPKVVMASFEGLTIWALIVWLGAAGMARERVVIYAWHPLPIWEFTSMAHIDAAATGLLVIAVLAAVQRRQGLAGALLGLAVLTKYFPIALIPASPRWFAAPGRRRVHRGTR